MKDSRQWWGAMVRGRAGLNAQKSRPDLGQIRLVRGSGTGGVVDYVEDSVIEERPKMA